MAAVALAQDTFSVKAKRDGSTYRVTITTPDGSAPEFLPVPVPENGAEGFDYTVEIAPGTDGRTVQVEEGVTPPGWQPAGEFTVTILSDGVRLEGDGVPDADAIFDVTIVTGLEGDTATFRGETAEAVLAFVLPTAAGTVHRILTLNSAGGVAETTRSVRPFGQETEPPSLEPKVAESSLPFDILTSTAVTNFANDAIEDGFGYGFGFAFPLSLDQTFRVQAVIQWHCITRSDYEEIFVTEIFGPGPGPGPGDDDVIIIDVDPIGPSTLITSLVRTDISIYMVDIGFVLQAPLSSWLFAGAQVGFGTLHGSVRGNRWAQTVGLMLSSPVAGGNFSFGYSLIITNAELDLPPGIDADLENIGAWTAGYQIAF
jgi:hypothetical protein